MTSTTAAQSFEPAERPVQTRIQYDRDFLLSRRPFATAPTAKLIATIQSLFGQMPIALREARSSHPARAYKFIPHAHTE